MKKIGLALLLTSGLLVACKGEHAKVAYTPADDAAIEMDDEAADTLVATAAEDDAMPVAADELFDDFFFNYADSKRLQLERTSFPLPVVRDGQQETIDRNQWKTESFFMQQDYYTLIFDSQRQMELVKDTAVEHVVVEKIMLSDEQVCQYLFNRQRGAWSLDKIVYEPLAHNPNAQFLKFYSHFVTDTLFQRQSLASQMDFIGPDPDDDFKTIEGVITPEFWDAFAPNFPDGVLYNIVYGHQNPAANQKIFVIRGIANGLEVEVTFALQRGRWKVTKLIT